MTIERAGRGPAPPRTRRCRGCELAVPRRARAPQQPPPQQGGYPTQGYPAGMRRRATGRPDLPYQPPSRSGTTLTGPASADRRVCRCRWPCRRRPAGHGDRCRALREAGVPVTGPHGRGYRGAGDGLVLLCVPDDAIAAAAAAVIVPGPLLGHCSGASGLDVLGEREGFSLHPLMTVTRDGADFSGVHRRGRRFERRARWPPRQRWPVRSVCARCRSRNPIASPITRPRPSPSNFLITLEAAAAELMATAGLDRDVLLPLARAALENWGRPGPAALTGPVARGDTRPSLGTARRSPNGRPSCSTCSTRWWRPPSGWPAEPGLAAPPAGRGPATRSRRTAVASETGARGRDHPPTAQRASESQPAP